jgi:hypothetical protein
MFIICSHSPKYSLFWYLIEVERMLKNGKGKDYEFRVRAKNVAGLGEPSNVTPMVTTKPKYSKSFQK